MKGISIFLVILLVIIVNSIKIQQITDQDSSKYEEDKENQIWKRR